MNRPKPTDGPEKKLIESVDAYGWHVIKVMGDDQVPPFAYTVGLFESTGHPEIVIVGMSLEDARRVLNELAGRVIIREFLEEGQRLTDLFFDNRPAAVRRVHDDYKASWFGFAKWFYQGTDFLVVQVFWSDPNGRFPWEPGCDAVLKSYQPGLYGPTNAE